MSPKQDRRALSTVLGWGLAVLALPMAVAVWWSGIIIFRQLSPCVEIDVGAGSLLLTGLTAAAVVLPLLFSLVVSSWPISVGARVFFCASPICVAVLYGVVLVVSLSFASTPPAIDIQGPAALASISLLPSVALATASVLSVSSTLTPRRRMVSIALVFVMLSLLGVLCLVFAYSPNCA